MGNIQMGDVFKLKGEEDKVRLTIMFLPPKIEQNEQECLVKSVSAYKGTEPFYHLTTESFIQRNFIKD